MYIKKYFIVLLVVPLLFLSFRSTKIELMIPPNEIKSVNVWHDLNSNRVSYNDYLVFYENVLQSKYFKKTDSDNLQPGEFYLAITTINENGDSEKFKWYSDYVQHFYNNKYIATYIIPAYRSYTSIFDMF